MDPTDLLPRSDYDKFLGLPYSERLEKLKPIIVQLYMENYGPGGKRMTMRQVAEFMRDQYALHLAGNQLEYNLRKWNVRRRILNREKDDVIAALGKRTRAGTSTSDATLQEGKLIDKKQIKRHLQDKIRRYVVEPMAPGVLTPWNLPYTALIKSITRQLDKPSPFGDLSVTPNYITINSPKDATAVSPAAIPSPSMQLVQQKLIQDQSNLFLQGRFQDLFVNCGREDRIALTNYLHDFWIHTFVTAKYWGRGPLLWTKDMISAMTLDSVTVSGSASPCPASLSTPSSLTFRDEPLLAPTQYCRWVIHVDEEHIYLNDSQDYRPPSNFDQDSWELWPLEEQQNRPLTQSMQESISDTSFTSMPPDSLPISSSLIAESLRKDPSSLKLESFKFAIMTGNLELLNSLLTKSKDGQDIHESLAEIHPYHLAASYVDGGNTCCSLLTTLVERLSSKYPIFRNNEDGMGHTVLDCLMISILRSHTSVSPREVSPSFADMKMYPGEEKDACGRWDADSPVIRQLFQRGSYRIPLGWKHPFCHSSVQAVCHNLVAMFLPGHGNSHIHHSSGLFIRHCSNCGVKLTLGTLHLVVVLAYYLAASGIQGETLFGTVAVLVCLLKLGANVLHKSEVSIHEIIGDSSENTCHHAHLDADDFMQTVPSDTIAIWRPECQIGWRCMLGIMRLAKAGDIRRTDKSNIHSFEARQYSGSGNQFIPMDIDDSENLDRQKAFNSDYENIDDEDNENDENDTLTESETSECPLEEFCPHDSESPCGNPQLGLVWAVVQAEMLTYRKILDVDPWISGNFSMAALRKWLEGETKELEMPLVQKEMLKKSTPCGWFGETNFPLHIAQDVTKRHIMNMDVYHRTSFHEVGGIYQSLW